MRLRSRTQSKSPTPQSIPEDKVSPEQQQSQVSPQNEDTSKVSNVFYSESKVTYDEKPPHEFDAKIDSEPEPVENAIPNAGSNMVPGDDQYQPDETDFADNAYNSDGLGVIDHDAYNAGGLDVTDNDAYSSAEDIGDEVYGQYTPEESDEMVYDPVTGGYSDNQYETEWQDTDAASEEFRTFYDYENSVNGKNFKGASEPSMINYMGNGIVDTFGNNVGASGGSLEETEFFKRQINGVRPPKRIRRRPLYVMIQDEVEPQARNFASENDETNPEYGLSEDREMNLTAESVASDQSLDLPEPSAENTMTSDEFGEGVFDGFYDNILPSTHEQSQMQDALPFSGVEQANEMAFQGDDQSVYTDNESVQDYDSYPMQDEVEDTAAEMEAYAEINDAYQSEVSEAPDVDDTLLVIPEESDGSVEPSSNEETESTYYPEGEQMDESTREYYENQYGYMNEPLVYPQSYGQNNFPQQRYMFNGAPQTWEQMYKATPGMQSFPYASGMQYRNSNQFQTGGAGYKKLTPGGGGMYQPAMSDAQMRYYQAYGAYGQPHYGNPYYSSDDPYSYNPYTDYAGESDQISYDQSMYSQQYSESGDTAWVGPDYKGAEITGEAGESPYSEHAGPEYEGAEMPGDEAVADDAQNSDVSAEEYEDVEMPADEVAGYDPYSDDSAWDGEEYEGAEIPREAGDAPYSEDAAWSGEYAQYSENPAWAGQDYEGAEMPEAGDAPYSEDATYSDQYAAWSGQYAEMAEGDSAPYSEDATWSAQGYEDTEIPVESEAPDSFSYSEDGAWAGQGSEVSGEFQIDDTPSPSENIWISEDPEASVAVDGPYADDTAWIDQGLDAEMSKEIETDLLLPTSDVAFDNFSSIDSNEETNIENLTKDQTDPSNPQNEGEAFSLDFDVDQTVTSKESNLNKEPVIPSDDPFQSHPDESSYEMENMNISDTSSANKSFLAGVGRKSESKGAGNSNIWSPVVSSESQNGMGSFDSAKPETFSEKSSTEIPTEKLASEIPGSFSSPELLAATNTFQSQSNFGNLDFSSGTGFMNTMAYPESMDFGPYGFGANMGQQFGMMDSAQFGQDNAFSHRTGGSERPRSKFSAIQEKMRTMKRGKFGAFKKYMGTS